MPCISVTHPQTEKKKPKQNTTKNHKEMNKKKINPILAC